jgi:molybdenum cofactor synthesis domain-containing protein
MITIQQARTVVLEHAAAALPAESVPIGSAVGRVLCEPVAADSDLPPFDRVMMDGYAVRAEDIAGATTGGEARLEVVEEVAAGDSAERALGAGEAHEIMTGAPLPPGANAVVPVEWTRRDGGFVLIDRPVKTRQHVASRAQDMAAGQQIAVPGERVTPLSLSLLIASGAGEVAVVRRPRVALLTSGNELVPPGAPIRRGQIRESNGPALAGMFASVGADVINLGVARDTREALAAKLALADDADVVVLTGGSSVGKYDLSAEVVEAAGGVLHFDKLSVKPGKPTIFHTRGGQLIFCLPGNPVAAMMTGRVLVCAAIAARAGLEPPAWSSSRLPLFGAVKRNAQRDLLIPVRRQDDILHFDGWHGSGDLACMARAEGFAYVERGEQPATPGTPADWFPLAADPSW